MSLICGGGGGGALIHSPQWSRKQRCDSRIFPWCSRHQRANCSICAGVASTATSCEMVFPKSDCSLSVTGLPQSAATAFQVGFCGYSRLGFGTALTRAGTRGVAGSRPDGIGSTWVTDGG
jgi:hypothetical protein